MSTLGRNISFPIYRGNGSSFHDLVIRTSTYDSIVMSLGDKITGEVYYKDNTLVCDMDEYIVYNGVHYIIVNPPTIVREGIVSENGGLNGMTKYSFELYHPMYKLGNIPFTDVAVTSAEAMFKSHDRTFSWIGSLDDYVAKLNKNLQGTPFIVSISSSISQAERAVLSEVLSFSDNTVGEALKTGYDTWKYPYVIDSIKSGEPYYQSGKRFLIQYGLPTQEILDADGVTPFVFRFGKGVGLKNNSRTPKNNKIVTRIAGYGSETNIPYGYPQIEWTGAASATETADGYPIYDGIVGGAVVRLIKHPFTRNHLMPSVYVDCVRRKVNSAASDYDNTIELVDYYDAPSTYPNPINLDSPSYEVSSFDDIKPELGNASILGATPLNEDLTPASGWDDTMDDDGNYLQSYFSITLPRLDFDLYACAAITEEMKINMRSGSCIGCTWDVQVDWDDYKKNFYDEDGNFLPNGEQRDLTKYPKSNSGSITVVVQKEYETFGVIMPNVYQHPASGDKFVILGISLPKTYITNAESRLDDAMKAHMLDNNVYYYEYPLKFDEDFLYRNTNILSQIRTNTVLRFQFAGVEKSLYVKQITVKYGESVLPQYNITLTDDIEIVLNQIGMVADDVSRLALAMMRQNQINNIQTFRTDNLQNYIRYTVNKNIDDIQNQLDHAQITYFGNVMPTEQNYPANEWTTDALKEQHVFDMYYDKSGNEGYEWKKINNGYGWVLITDPNTIEALRIASQEQDTLDGKRRVFVTAAGTLPAPPYDQGDLWVNATYPSNSTATNTTGNNPLNYTYFDDILKCVTPRANGDTASISDWSLASNYVDAHAFDQQFALLAEDIDEIREQEDRKFDIWFAAYEPLPFMTVDPVANTSGKHPATEGWLEKTGENAYVTSTDTNPVSGKAYYKRTDNANANAPASDWINDGDESVHVQDLFYDTEKEPALEGGRAYRWKAIEIDEELVYRWMIVSDADTITALEKIADVASDGVLSGGAEKTRVLNDWEEAVSDYIAYYTRAGELGIRSNTSDTPFYEYDQSFRILGGFLNGGSAISISISGGVVTGVSTPSWIDSNNLDEKTDIIGSVTIDGHTYTNSEAYRQSWQNYNTRLTKLVEAVHAREKELIDDIASDGILSGGTEKTQLQSEWQNALQSFTTRIASAGRYGVNVTDFTNAFTNLVTFLNDGVAPQPVTNKPSYLSNISSDTDIRSESITIGGNVYTGGDAFRKVWGDFYSELGSIDNALDSARGNATSSKMSVFVGNSLPTPPYAVGDMWVNATYSEGGVSYSNDILTCVVANNTDTGRLSDWAKASDYTNDTTVNSIIAKYGDILGVSPTAVDVGEALGLLRKVLQGGDVQTDGGLILASMIVLKNSNNVMSGMNGAVGASGLATPAAWYGGKMLDFERLTDQQKEQGWNALRWAKSLFRFDGSGYVAGGGISWDTNGQVTITGYSISASDSMQVGNSNVLTESYGDSRYVTKAYFDALFKAYTQNGSAITTNTANPQVSNVEIRANVWTSGEMSAHGYGSGGSGQGGSGSGITLSDMWSALAGSGNEQISATHLATALGGYVNEIRFNGSTTFTPTSGVIDIPVVNTNTSLSWGASTAIATVGNQSITVTMPSNPNTNTTYTFASGSVNGAFSVTPSGGSAQLVSIHGLGGAAYKAVDSSISTGSVSENLPTSSAVASFVEGKGYITSSALNGYATESWVNNKGYALASSVPTKITDLTNDWPLITTQEIDTGTDDNARTVTAKRIADWFKTKPSIFVGTCSSAADAQAKSATVDSSFQLVKGVIVSIKFTYTNTYSATAGNLITLNVNNTGNKNIQYGTTTATTGVSTICYGDANYYITYIYDGTNWVWLNRSVDTTYSGMTDANLKAGTETTGRLVSAKLLTDNFWLKSTAYNKNLVLASSATADGNAATFRALVADDIPSLDASKITSGTLDSARIPSLSWTKITSDKPITLSGYGITDAVSAIVVGTDDNASKIGVTVNGSNTGFITVPFATNATNATSSTTASKLSTVSKTAWGQTYWTSGGVPDNVDGKMTITFSGTANELITLKATGSSAAYNCISYEKVGSGSYNWSVGINSSNMYYIWNSKNSKRVFDIDADGNTVIGDETIDTNYKLKVAGKFYAGGNSSIGGNLSVGGSARLYSVLNITGTTSYSEGIRIHHVEGLSSIWFGAENLTGYDAGMWGISVNSNGMRFRGAASTTATYPIDYINILHGGNVGIGTTSPSYKLHINGTTGISNILTLTGARGSTQRICFGDANHYIECDSSGNFSFSHDVTASKFVKSGGTSSQFLKADGSVDSNTYALNTAVGFKTASRVSDGLLSLVDGGGVTTYIDLSHEHSYYDLTDRPTDLEEFGLEDEATVVRVYRQTSGYDADYPIIVSRTATIGDAGTNNSYTNVYGVVYDSNQPTVNPNTGKMKVYALSVNGVDITGSSDERLKDVVGDVKIRISDIASAPSVLFRWKDKRDEKVRIGSIAQYWEKALPESVSSCNDGSLWLDYGALALCSATELARAISKHDDRLTKLERENEVLIKRVDKLEKRVSELEKRIAA